MPKRGKGYYGHEDREKEKNVKIRRKRKLTLDKGREREWEKRILALSLLIRQQERTQTRLAFILFLTSARDGEQESKDAVNKREILRNLGSSWGN
jgi:hypothetical protein